MWRSQQRRHRGEGSRMMQRAERLRCSSQKQSHRGAQGIHLLTAATVVALGWPIVDTRL